MFNKTLPANFGLMQNQTEVDLRTRNNTEIKMHKSPTNDVSYKFNVSFEIQNYKLQDAKSAISRKSGKTQYTSRTKFTQGGPKIISTTNLAPVGLKKDEEKPANIQTEKFNRFLDDQLGTEVLINKILEIINPEEEDENAEEFDETDWPIDTIPNPKVRRNLSYTKMINEVNHRNPRKISTSSEVVPHPIFGTEIGSHSVDPKKRRSDVEQLGPATNLYFKMLKFFGVMFFVFHLISLPSMYLYWTGNAYEGHPLALQRLLSILSLGSLNTATELITAYANITDQSNLAFSKIELKCSSHRNMFHLHQFGLSIYNETFEG